MSHPILDYIKGCPEERQAYLTQLHELIVSLLPEDTEQRLAWGMPSYKRSGYIIHFANNKANVGLYPGPEAIEALPEDLGHYRSLRRVIHLDPEAPIPTRLVETLIRINLGEA